MDVVTRDFRYQTWHVYESETRPERLAPTEANGHYCFTYAKTHPSPEAGRGDRQPFVIRLIRGACCVVSVAVIVVLLFKNANRRFRRHDFLQRVFGRALSRTGRR